MLCALILIASQLGTPPPSPWTQVFGYRVSVPALDDSYREGSDLAREPFSAWLSTQTVDVTKDYAKLGSFLTTQKAATRLREIIDIVDLPETRIILSGATPVVRITTTTRTLIGCVFAAS